MAPAITRRQQILAVLVGLVEAIQMGDTFATDAGLNVTLGESPELGPDDEAYAINVVVGDEDPATPGQTKATFVTMPVEFQMLAKTTDAEGRRIDDAWLVIEAGLGDIKRAIEQEDRKLGGLANTMERGGVRTLPREPGSLTVGAGATYNVSYQENWGNP